MLLSKIHKFKNFIYVCKVLNLINFDNNDYKKINNNYLNKNLN